MTVPADQSRLIKRLRTALVLVAMLVGIAVIAVIGVLFYWNSYLLGSRGDDPFTRGWARRRLWGGHDIRAVVMSSPSEPYAVPQARRQNS